MKKHTILLGSILAIIAIGLICGMAIWSRLHTEGVAKEGSVYVPTGADYGQLLDSLSGDSGGRIEDVARFDKVARLYGLDKSVRPGRYRLRTGMSYAQCVKMFRNGLQSPVRLTFNNIRTLPLLAGRIAQQIEADSLAMLSALTDAEISQSYGFDEKNFIGMFLPDTYEVWWTISPQALLDRMKKEYDRFWTESRLEKLAKTGLTRQQAVTLASIVYEETKMADEMPIVAGVYVNRLNRKMPLQADPTVKFAVGDFSLRRILHRHLEVDSPYNTYKYAGLPPGPISMPSVKAIEAVLDFAKHNYIYFCARPDYSGYHNFAVTLAEHNRNAQAYYRFLNREGIR